MNKNLIFAISTLLVFVLAACSSTASATPSEAPASTTAPLDTNTAISSTAVESTPIPPDSRFHQRFFLPKTSCPSLTRTVLPVMAEEGG